MQVQVNDFLSSGIEIEMEEREDNQDEREHEDARQELTQLEPIEDEYECLLARNDEEEEERWSFANASKKCYYYNTRSTQQQAKDDSLASDPALFVDDAVAL